MARLSFIFVFITLFYMAPQPVEASNKIAASEMIGHKWTFKRWPFSGTVHYKPNTVTATFRGKTYHGTLRVIDNKVICVTYPDFFDGKEVCTDFIKLADRKYRSSRGAVLTR